jgi:hypothetical protein
MKRKSMKLHLSKDTVSNLDRPELKGALGGWGTIETECCASMNITRCSCHERIQQ